MISAYRNEISLKEKNENIEKIWRKNEKWKISKENRNLELKWRRRNSVERNMASKIEGEDRGIAKWPNEKCGEYQRQLKTAMAKKRHNGDANGARLSISLSNKRHACMRARCLAASMMAKRHRRRRSGIVMEGASLEISGHRRNVQLKKMAAETKIQIIIGNIWKRKKMSEAYGKISNMAAKNEMLKNRRKLKEKRNGLKK